MNQRDISSSIYGICCRLAGQCHHHGTHEHKQLSPGRKIRWRTNRALLIIIISCFVRSTTIKDVYLRSLYAGLSVLYWKTANFIMNWIIHLGKVFLWNEGQPRRILYRSYEEKRGNSHSITIYRAIIKFQFYHLTTIRKVWKQNKNIILLCYWLRHGIFVQKTTWNN